MTNSEGGSVLPGLQSLWAETTGSPEVLIAVLDGPADLSHPCFAGANLSVIDGSEAAVGPAAQHGTHVASIIFGQHSSEIKGVAPRCAGLIIPIFDNTEDGSIIPCSEIKLASAIMSAVSHAERLFPGKREALPLIINISGGQFSRTGHGHPLLADAVRKCADKNVLIVAAAGNEGCDCLHVPGAMPSVLAVGAMDDAGAPLPMSNWGSAYQTQGILAPGQNIRGAQPGGGVAASSGTSFAAPVVSGVAALLLSLQSKLGRQPNPQQVGKALLASAVKCNPESISDCRQYLAGVLNIDGAVSIITEGGSKMPEQVEAQASAAEAVSAPEQMQAEGIVMSGEAAEAATTKEQEGVKMAQEPAKPKCGCGQEKWSDKFVYAIGTIGVDFVNQARQDSLQYHSDLDKNKRQLSITLPVNLLRYLLGWKEEGVEKPHDPHMYDAKSIYWTLCQDSTPLYIVQPMGPFAEDGYRELVDFYTEQTGYDINTGEPIGNTIERVAISGVIVGEAKLSTNEVVPIIVPHMRGTSSWSTKCLAKDLACKTGLAQEVIEKIMERMYEETRNFGSTPEERALNYAATDLFRTIESARILPGSIDEKDDKVKWELDEVEVSKSPVCRADSECYDVGIIFYNPDNLQQARRAIISTVDVSDVVPVPLGKARTFSKR